jgi:hypothetical protein
MRVQAFQAMARASNTTVRNRPGMVFRHSGVTLGSIADVGSLQFTGIDRLARTAHTAASLQLIDGTTCRFADQPEARWHRPTVAHQRRVANNDGVASFIAHYDLEWALGRTAQQLFDSLPVCHGSAQ